MNDNHQKQLGAGMSATKVQSEKTNDEQAEAIRRSPDYLRVKDELFRIYNDVGERLTETLKPLGIDVVQVHIRSAIPKNVRGLYGKLTAVRIVPEAKADAAESQDEFPSWLEGNLC
jgi:hypothetical protein